MENLINTVDRVLKQNERTALQDASQEAARHIFDLLEDPIAFSNLTPNLVASIIYSTMRNRREL